MAQPSFHFHRGPLGEATRAIPGLRFFEAYLSMVPDLEKLAAADTFTEWFSPSSSFVDRDGYVWRSPSGIFAGMQKTFRWAKMRVEHNETKVLAGVVLLRPGVGVLEVLEAFGEGQAARFKDKREKDLIGDLLLCEHTVYFTPLLPDGSMGKEVGVSRTIEFYDGPAEVEGQGTYGRQHWYGKVWFDIDGLKTEVKRMVEANKAANKA
jgi:hypothetical protein